MKYILCLPIFILYTIGISQSSIYAHRYTVSLNPGFYELETTHGKSPSQIIKSIKSINPAGNILSIEFKEFITQDEELKWLRENISIAYFQAVSALEPRGCNPNDKDYWRQFNMEIMKFDEAWCFKNEGVSPLGDTIVIGAIDRGFNFQYADLIQNIFINRGEIPDNGLDDDNNNYIDDYYGLNAQSIFGGDDHQNDTHGTQVISVIAARGNNNLDISGTNQKVKMLICSADDSDELLRCYYYFLKMKRDYLNSSGTKGAYLISSNLSAGFSNSFPNGFPLICQVYDSLGSVGILTSAATINDGDDIDLVGDIPGLCPSEHLIVVTNTNRMDQKVSDAGFSKNNVDIGATGEDIPMLDRNGMVKNESGTSFASPHVAGAIALLYQYCPKINALSKTTPSEASKLMRAFILQCGDELSSLENVTTTGKRLNMIQSLQCLNTYCIDDSIANPRVFLKNNLRNENIEISIHPTRFGNYNLLIFNNLGQLISSKTLAFFPDQENKYQVEIYAWPTGAYHFIIEGHGFKASKSLIKY